MRKWPYNRGGLPWGGQLVVFYYLSASEIWPYNRGVLCPYKKGNTIYLFLYKYKHVINLSIFVGVTMDDIFVPYLEMQHVI